VSTALIIESTRNVVSVEGPDRNISAVASRMVVEVNPSTTIAQALIGFQAENKSGEALPAGCIVAKHASGSGVIKAHADVPPLIAVGLITTSRASTEVGSVLTDGVLELADWTAVVGSAQLATNASYFLSTVPGRLTTTMPSGPGRIAQYVGKALSPTALDISIMNPIWRN
jgi:hypothetical protein